MNDTDTSAPTQEISLLPLGVKRELRVTRHDIVPQKPASLQQRFGLFIWTFLVPVACAFLYLFVIASDRYMSEAKFVVRSTRADIASTAKAGMESAGLRPGRTGDEAHIVTAYILSRDALAWLQRNQDVSGAFNRPGADFINRFPNIFVSNNQDNLYKHYLQMVDAEVDDSTGISSIAVQAFVPEDAKNIASDLLRAAEDLVNRLNERQLRDSLRLSREMVAEAKARLMSMETKLAKYREDSKFIDPSGESSSRFQTITLLSTQLAQTEATVSQMKILTPENPAISSLVNKATSLRSEIARQKLALVGDSGSIAGKLAEYDTIVIEQAIAAKALTAAEINLQLAEHNVGQQQLYLETVAQPNLPDQQKYPRRLLYFTMSVIVAAVVFVTLRSLRQFAIEHST